MVHTMRGDATRQRRPRLGPILFCLYVASPILAQQSTALSQSTASVAYEGLVEYYSTHGTITDPGPYAAMYEGLPTELPEIIRVVQGVLTRGDHPELEGMALPQERRDENNLRKVEDILKRMKEMDERPVVFKRERVDRVLGCCRHFAVLACSMLRHQGTPARARGGFEAYFSPNAHHDHWICEYWKEDEERWVQIDAEPDVFLRKKWKIDFDIQDLPPGKFMTGAQAWMRCRKGEMDPNHCGIMTDRWLGGWGFVKGELVLDIMALNKMEMLPWDKNPLVEKSFQDLTDRELELLDRAAEIVLQGNRRFEDLRDIYNSEQILRMTVEWLSENSLNP